MLLSPDTEIKFLHVPISLDQKNQLTFDSKNEQAKYFLDNVIYEFDEVSFQRENNVIRLNKNYDECYNLNYVMYQNNVISNKWIYAFITGKTYVNENRTDIQIVTDVFQTWQFDMKFNDSFVEREMCNVSDDVPGNYLYPESFEIGEPQIQATQNISDLEPVAFVAFSGETLKFQGTSSASEIKINQSGYLVNGIPSTCAFLFCEVNSIPILIGNINSSGQGDKIISCFTVPKLSCSSFFNENNEIAEVIDFVGVKHKIYCLQGDFTDLGVLPHIMEYTQPEKAVTVFSRPSNLDGYTPRNKKLLTYPYCYFGINLPNSSQKIFRFEDFTSSSNQFTIISEVNPNPTILLIPKNYKNNQKYSIQDSVAITGYPLISTRTDYFNTWLAQNSQIVNLQMQQEQYNYEINQMKSGIQFAQSLLSLGLAGGSEGALGIFGIANDALSIGQADVNHEFYIKNTIAQVQKQSLLPDTVNLSSSNATLVGYDLIDNSVFNLYTIRTHFARVIDDYFDMYGYAINQVKKPNLRNRPNWNYIKTIGANITGKNISQNDILALKNMFDNGVTLWHNPDNFLDYSKKNR